MKTIVKKVRIAIIVSMVLILSANQLFADNETISIGKRVTIHSKILNENRVLLISLPSGYNNSEIKYPVLYLLDGGTHFMHASAAVDYLAGYRFTPEIIVVAIVNIDRNRDFTPIKTERFKTDGGAAKFHNFITEEVMPYMEKNYLSSDYNILMGHSLGGTFIGYSLLEHPETFDSYIAVSPFLQFADGYIVDEAKSKLKKKYNQPKSFYMSIGNEPDYYPTLDKFSELIQKKSGKSIDFMYVNMKDDNHSTTPYPTLFNGLRFIFSDWVVPQEVYNQGLVVIDEHFKKLSKKYSYEITVSENTINLMGYNYLRNKEIEKAIDIFIENTKRFPNSANVYDSLGEAYENNDQLDLALINYKKAVKLGNEQQLGTLSTFEANLQRVKDLLNK